VSGSISSGYGKALIVSFMWPLFRLTSTDGNGSSSTCRRDDDDDDDGTMGSMGSVEMIGVGVTEAGLIAPTTSTMEDLFALLVYIHQHQFYSTKQKICIINT
jgi:hypothetical protein